MKIKKITNIHILSQGKPRKIQTNFALCNLLRRALFKKVQKFQKNDDIDIVMRSILRSLLFLIDNITIHHSISKSRRIVHRYAFFVALSKRLSEGGFMVGRRISSEFFAFSGRHRLQKFVSWRDLDRKMSFDVYQWRIGWSEVVK